MGDSLFPAFTGLNVAVERTPTYNTKVYKSPGGARQTVSWRQTPEYSYALKANYLLDALGEVAKLLAFHAGLLGSAGTCWYLDPWDGKLRQVAFGEDSLPVRKLASGAWEASWMLVTTIPATLDSVTIAPLNPSKVNPGTQQFTATGHLSDGSTRDLTATVSWASGTPAHATINAAGLATTVAAGTSVITASFAPLSASTTMTVT